MRTAIRLRWGLLIIALALVALSAFLLLRRPKTPEPEPDPHEGQVYIYDGYDWVWMTPLEGVPVNPIKKEDFVSQGTTPVYLGTDYTLRRGIDVSEHQHSVDWARVASCDVDFAFIRIGRRGYTEGGLFEDPYYRDNISGAQANGIDVGVYFFSQALTVQEAIEEANFVIDRLSGYRITMPVVFDWEKIPDTSSARTNDLSMETRTDCAVAFCQTLKNAGYEPCVYFNRTLGYYGYDLSRLTDYRFWFSLPEMGYPSFYYAVDFWQYSFSEIIAGVEGTADMNMMLIPTATETAQPDSQ